MSRHSNNTKKYQLAIVIPAYRKKYFRETLDSLCGQTDQRFRVYVGDDASPDDLKQTCKDYESRLDIQYKRFSENFGKTSLVEHWNRCVRLSNEPWCWLLCDDDVLGPTCVEFFFCTLGQKGKAFSVYRFNTSMIDAENRIFKVNPDHPEIESGIEFAISRFRQQRSSFVSEYIFSRQTFDIEGGFINFPIAWCSDDATWIAFSGTQGIYTINGPRVLWRYSGLNISTPGDTYREQKTDALFQYLKWFWGRIATKNVIINEYDYSRLKTICIQWLYYQLFFIGPVGLANYGSLWRRMNSIFERGWCQTVLGLLMVDYRFYKSLILKKLLRIKNAAPNSVD